MSATGNLHWINGIFKKKLCQKMEYQWQRLLQEIPGFALVDVQDVQKEPKSGAVHFTIVVSSVIPEQIYDTPNT